MKLGLHRMKQRYIRAQAKLFCLRLKRMATGHNRRNLPCRDLHDHGREGYHCMTRHLICGMYRCQITDWWDTYSRSSHWATGNVFINGVGIPRDLVRRFEQMGCKNNGIFAQICSPHLQFPLSFILQIPPPSILDPISPSGP
jgi:hypothetical protein